jgi:hypothetical protein
MWIFPEHVIEAIRVHKNIVWQPEVVSFWKSKTHPVPFPWMKDYHRIRLV